MTGLGARAPNGQSEMSKVSGVNSDKQPAEEDAHASRFENIVSVQQLIDLTDKPIRLTPDEIGWSRVKSNASNCVCCCCNNSITLVTTDDSYVLDHIPLDNIEAAQANSGLQYLALANDVKLAVIDLVESKLGDGSASLRGKAKPPRRIPAAGHTNSASTQTRYVDLGALDLSMSDVLFWRWIDELTLALVTQGALYTCRVDQIQLNHPATTAALGRPLNQFLALTRICDIDPNLGHLCQITDVQRDASTNLYAISGLYSPQSIINSSSADTHDLSNTICDNSSSIITESNHSQQNQDNNNNNNSPVKQNLMQSISNPLRHNFSSVPGRLSHMTSHGSAGSPQPASLDSAFNLATTKPHNSSRAIDSLRRKISSSSSKSKKISTTNSDIQPTVAGLTQIYCKLRDRTQLIRAHAVSFTTRMLRTTRDDSDEQRHATTLVAANRQGNKLKVYFIGMATSEDLMTSGQNIARSTKLDPTRETAGRADFPTAIVCSTLKADDDKTHVAMIITKYGHLFVCSVTHSNVLFDVQVSYGIVSGAVLESKSRGLMLICRNGQVLLVRIDEDKLRRRLDDTNSMRHVPSQLTVSLSREYSEYRKSPICNVTQEPLDMGLEVIISTKL